METRLLLGTIAIVGVSLCLAAPGFAAEPTKDECIDANESAQSLGQTGKLIAERQKLLVCVASSCPGPIRQDCAQRLAEVDAKMPSLVLEAQDDQQRDLAAVRVTMDGHPLFDRLDGKAFQVDPGEHHFVLEASGLSRAEKVIVVREADKNRHERVVLVASATAPAAGPEAAQQAGSDEGAPAAPTALAPEQPSDGHTQRVIGLALGGAGVVGGLVGAAFGLASKSTYDHAYASECGSTAGGCTPAGYQDGQTAHSQATIATVGFIGGVALLGGGALLYFTAPKGTEVSFGPTVGKTEAGLSFHGKW